MSKDKNNKTTTVGKHVDTVDMRFALDTPGGGGVTTDDKGRTMFTGTTKEFTPAAEAKPPKTREFAQDGKKVYVVNEDTNEYTWFTDEGKPVDAGVIEVLASKYPRIPEQDDLGTERDGPYQYRMIDENGNSEGHPDFTGKIWALHERQNYQSGQAIINTIPIKHLAIVKVLRGEIGNTENKKEEDRGTEVVEG